MKKFLYLAAAILTLAACSGVNPEEKPINDYLIVNNGNWGGNDASISSFDISTGTCSNGLFLQANGEALGDLAQDILIYKDNILIAVNGSKIIHVTDRNLKKTASVVAKISIVTLSPRYMISVGDKIYVTYYEGYLGEINPSDWSVRVTEVGPNPEGLAYSNGKIYVANSGGYVLGYNNTVSVVDVASFKEEKTITVNVNPNKMIVAGDKLYVSSLGNYVDIPAKLQVVDLSSNSVADVIASNVNNFDFDGKKTLYVLCGSYNEKWELEGSVVSVNTADNTVSEAIVSSISNAYSISSCGGYICVGCSDYKTNGDMYFYNKSGEEVAKTDTGGLNPIKVIALK